MPTTSSTPMPTTGSLQLVEAVIERFDGAPVGERRRWSDEFKAQAVAAALEPGVNVSALARRLGISPPQLFGWRKAFLKKQEADIMAGTPTPMPTPMVEIVVGEVTIRVGPDVSEAALRRILRAVRSP
ncbi:transposase [Rhodobacter capsulatus]|uniref:Transposase n=1 Tax=Rhodobacter capsulatus TaxID=1061 RepID=A0A4U1JKZ3_RHOCA|nr:transposase [Rhodobacter capsulatus]